MTLRLTVGLGLCAARLSVGLCVIFAQRIPRRASELGDLTSTIHEILTQVVQAGAVKGASAQGQAH